MTCGFCSQPSSVRSSPCVLGFALVSETGATCSPGTGGLAEHRDAELPKPCWGQGERPRGAGARRVCLAERACLPGGGVWRGHWGDVAPFQGCGCCPVFEACFQAATVRIQLATWALGVTVQLVSRGPAAERQRPTQPKALPHEARAPPAPLHGPCLSCWEDQGR